MYFHRLRTATDDFFGELDEIEVALVSRVAAGSESLKLQWVACALTRAGNGVLYPLLTLILIASERVGHPARFVATVSINLAIAFTVYPLLKHALSRTRPCDYEPALARYGEPLDRYSCPSGHTMTAVAFSVTVLFAWPDSGALGIPLCMAMGWSRIALGHHYPTDVLLGGALGAAVSVPVSAFVY